MNVGKNQKTGLLWCLSLGVILAGCNRQPTPTEGEAKASATRFHQSPPVEPPEIEPSIVETPEIIRILENERIKEVLTSHSQHIYIELEDGRRYQGKYHRNQAGNYANDFNLGDILNLVLHIKKHRLDKDAGRWAIGCE